MCDCADEKGMKQGEIWKQDYSLPDLGTKKAVEDPNQMCGLENKLASFPPSGFI
jgi:hypothetical protein